MNNNLYFCTQDNNTCIKKESCKRYIEYIEDINNCHAALFNVACTENNNYILYMKVEENNNEQSKDA